MASPVNETSLEEIHNSRFTPSTVSNEEPQDSVSFPDSLLKVNCDEDNQYFNQPGAKIDFVLKYVHKLCKPNDYKWYKCATKQFNMRAQPIDHKEHLNKLMSYIGKLRQEKKLLIQVKEDQEVSGTYYFMISATFEALKEGAEDLALQKSVEPDMTNQEREKDKEVLLNKHKFKLWHRNLLKTVLQRDFLSFTDPQFEKKDSIGCLTVPYIRQRHDKYKNSYNEEEFFTDAERIAITSHFLENPVSTGSTYEEGLSELIHEGYLTDAYPLHDKAHDDGTLSDHQILAKEWSNPFKLYKSQPFENIRQYFGEKIGLYFVWLGYYTYWLIPAAFIGVIVTLCGLYTISLDNNPIAQEICNESNREFFYMCPRCNDVCDFWYYISGCTVARFSLVFDNGGTVFFAVFIMLWANLFIEFWKRRFLLLQFQWDTIEYDITDEKPLPQFLKQAKKYVISKQNKPDEEVDSDRSRSSCGCIEYFRNMFKHQYMLYEVLPNYSVGVWDYYESRSTFWPKLFLTFSVVLTLVVALLGIVIAIIIYRITVSTLTYRIVHTVSGGVVTSNYIVSFSALGIQVVCIFALNIVYGYIARYLTTWELHRTASDYEASYTMKMYLFYFVNFYSSIFYIAFIKGRFVGYPSNFNRITVFALEQCNAEGCQLELARQMFVIFFIKLVWDNAQQLLKPLGTRIWIYIKNKQMKNNHTRTDDSYTEAVSLKRMDHVDEHDEQDPPVWKKDDVLVPCDGMLSIGKHSLFYEYLEIVIQYGFVTIFVAAFPLAPLMALINNIFEIRLDASKFVKMYRRPVPERTNDQAAWLSIIQFVTTLSVITNGLIIAFTSTYIDRLVYQYAYDSTTDDGTSSSCSIEDDCSPDRGFVTWSTSSFELKALLEPNGIADKTTDFPLLSILKLPLYENGEVVKRSAVVGSDIGQLQPVLYQPYLNFDCLAKNMKNFNFSNFTESEYSHFYLDNTFQNLTLRTVGLKDDEDILTGTGICFDQTIKCRFRGQHEANGAHPLKYYRTLSVKLGIALVFENFIFIVVMVVCYIIPDTPYSVKMERRLEKKLTQNLWKGKEELFEHGVSPT